MSKCAKTQEIQELSGFFGFSGGGGVYRSHGRRSGSCEMPLDGKWCPNYTHFAIIFRCWPALEIVSLGIAEQSATIAQQSVTSRYRIENTKIEHFTSRSVQNTQIYQIGPITAENNKNLFFLQNDFRKIGKIENFGEKSIFCLRIFLLSIFFENKIFIEKIKFFEKKTIFMF